MPLVAACSMALLAAVAAAAVARPLTIAAAPSYLASSGHFRAADPTMAIAARRNRRRRRQASVPSFKTRLQQAKTAGAAIEVLRSASSSDEIVSAFDRMARLVPRERLSLARTGSAVAALIASTERLSPSQLSPLQCCTLLWSLGMLLVPTDPTLDAFAADLAGALASDSASNSIAPIRRRPPSGDVTR